MLFWAIYIFQVVTGYLVEFHHVCIMLYFVTAARGTEDFVIDELKCKCQPSRVTIAKSRIIAQNRLVSFVKKTFLLLLILCRAASTAALSHTGGFRVGGGVHDSCTSQCGLVGSFTSPGPGPGIDTSR